VRLLLGYNYCRKTKSTPNRSNCEQQTRIHFPNREHEDKWDHRLKNNK